MLADIAAGDAVVTNCASRGYFPTIANLLDPDTPLHLSMGRDLVIAIDGGWMPPAGGTYFLHASCPGATDVFGALTRAGIPEPVRVGSLTVRRVLAGQCCNDRCEVSTAACR